nr:hypothetical protein [Tanacetum cinerariifolium]
MVHEETFYRELLCGESGNNDSEAYPLLEEIKLKRMVVSDEGLEMIGRSFDVLRNLRELDLRESEGEDLSRHWLSHFPDACTSLESLNMSCLSSKVSLSALQPAFSKCKELKSLYGFWDVDPYYLPVFYSVCSRLTFLNLSYASIESPDVSKIISQYPNLQCLWGNFAFELPNSEKKIKRRIMETFHINGNLRIHSNFSESNTQYEVKIDDPNITMEEYTRLEEEKARRRGKVYNWKTATYVSPLNDNKTDFRISFDESDDEDYTMIYDKNSFSYKIIFVNNLKSDSENDNDKVNMPSFSSPKPTISYFDDLDFFKDFKNEFSAIVYNDALTSKLDFITEPSVSPQHIDEFDLKDETSLSECDEEEQNVLCFNDLFPFNVIYPDDSKSD